MKTKHFLLSLCGALLAPAIPLGALSLSSHPQTAMERFSSTFRPISSMEDTVGYHPLPAIPLPGSQKHQQAGKKQIESVPTIYGSIISSKAGDDGSAANGKGMWTFNAGGPVKRLNTNGNAQYGGAPLDNGSYYAVMRSGSRYYIDKFTISTWKRATHTSLSSTQIAASDVAYDPTSGWVYGCFYNDAANGYVFGRADYTTRKREIIKPLSVGYNAVMVDAAGQVYAIDMNGMLMKVDKTSGETTNIGATNVLPQYVSSGTIDLNTGRCYWCVNPADGKSYLYEIDLATGQATLLHQFVHSDEFCGIYVPENAPAAAAPAAPSNLAANFSAGSLTGSISFTLPTTTTDGSTLEGSIEYTVWIDGIAHTTAQGAAGAEITLPITLSAAGIHTAVVRCSNSAGAGKRVRIKTFAGNDTPKAPAPKLQRSGNAFTISWAKVTGSVNGGYMDADRVTYRITRLPDNVVVAESCSDTTFTDPVAPTPGRVIAYRYSVSASFEGNTGAAGITAPYPLGEISAPWSEGFDNADALDNFLILDSNNDGVTWKYSASMSSAYITNASVKHDDWLITAAIRMEKGVNYKLAFEAMASFNEERIEVRMGSSTNPSEMTTVLVEPTVLEADMSLKPSVPEFTVPESGLYYIGWHAISDANAFYMYLDNITLTDDANHDIEAITPPYLQTFDESASLKDFTIIDGNNDGYMWNIDRNEARVLDGADLNDWLISPPMNLKAGNRYEVSLLAHSYITSTNEAYLELRVGTSANVDSLATVLIPAVTLTSATDPVKLAKYFAPDKDGKYYIAMHATGHNGVYVDNFRVASPVTAASPGMPADAKITPAPYGELRATVSFKAPTLTVDGSALSSLDKIEVLMNDSVVNTFNAPQPGAELQCDVTVETSGVHDFAITAYNSAGAGIPAELSEYIGVNIPSYPTNVVMTEEGNTGKVTLTWKAPATDINGNPIRPTGITYIVADVINGQSALLARDITDTTFSVQAISPDAAQQFKTYCVFASNAAGISQGCYSNSAPVGKPYTVPYQESFPNGTSSHLAVTQVLQPQGAWNTFNDTFFNDVTSQDNDNGFCGFISQNAGAAGVFFTGKINLGDFTKPELVFYTYNPYADNTNELLVQLLDNSGNAHTLLSKQMSQIGQQGWNKVKVSLKPYENQTIRLALATICKSYGSSLFDNFVIDNTLGTEEIELTGVTVGTRPGTIDIAGTDGRIVTVTDIQGCVRFNAAVAESTSVQVESGIYIVRVDDFTCKVAVK